MERLLGYRRRPATGGCLRSHGRVCSVGAQLVLVKGQILEADRRIIAWHRSNEMSRRLETIPGVGPLIATALVASVADPQAFGSARDVSAWIGLVPKQHSTGGKARLGSISKARRSLSAHAVHGWRLIGDPTSQARSGIRGGPGSPADGPAAD